MATPSKNEIIFPKCLNVKNYGYYLLYMGYIYLIGQSDTPNIFKIGCTRGNVMKRSKTLQTGNSEELYIANSFETNTPFKLEKMLHLKYAPKLYLNEWYELTKYDVDNFTASCQLLQSSIDSLSDNPFF